MGHKENAGNSLKGLPDFTLQRVISAKICVKLCQFGEGGDGRLPDFYKMHYILKDGTTGWFLFIDFDKKN